MGILKKAEDESKKNYDCSDPLKVNKIMQLTSGEIDDIQLESYTPSLSAGVDGGNHRSTG